MMSRVQVCMYLAVMTGLVACKKEPPAAPTPPPLTWQQFIEDPSVLNVWLEPGQSPECLDGQVVLMEDAGAVAYIPPCSYVTAANTPHGYSVRVAQFTREGLPYMFGVEFAQPVPVADVPGVLGLPPLESFEGTQITQGHRPSTYTRWGRYAAPQREVWLAEAISYEKDAGMTREVLLHVNPFDEVSSFRKLMIKGGFPVIEPSHVQPLSWQPDLARQAQYAVAVHLSEEGARVNGARVAASMHTPWSEQESRRFDEAVRQQFDMRSKQAKLLKQAPLSAAHLDLAQLTPWHDAVNLLERLRASGAGRVDLAVTVLDERSDRARHSSGVSVEAFMTHGRTSMWTMPTTYHTREEIFAEEEPSQPHVWIGVNAQGVTLAMYGIPGESSVARYIPASCLTESCLEPMPTAEQDPPGAQFLRPQADGMRETVSAAFAQMDRAHLDVLSEAIRRLQRAHPGLETLVVEPSPDTPLQVVVGVIDAATLELDVPQEPGAWPSVTRQGDALRFRRVACIGGVGDE